MQFSTVISALKNLSFLFLIFLESFYFSSPNFMHFLRILFNALSQFCFSEVLGVEEVTSLSSFPYPFAEWQTGPKPLSLSLGCVWYHWSQSSPPKDPHFRSYLSGHSQFIYSGSVQSQTALAHHSVPQASVFDLSCLFAFLRRLGLFSFLCWWPTNLHQLLPLCHCKTLPLPTCLPAYLITTQWFFLAY